mmetsp:Transcript_50731/g.165777  ORF Transcript_50731/g.165777 Transcript_50731/m.165777 type:complete len:418 (-) Transcript_50731:579-1832(-)
MRTTLRRSRSAVARAVELGAIEQYAKIGGRAAWSGAQLQQSPWWGRTLSASHVDELDSALKMAMRSGAIEWDGEIPMAVGRDVFPLREDGMGGLLRGLAEELEDGTGATMLQGIPVERYTISELSVLYLGICGYIGNNVLQSSAGLRSKSRGFGMPVGLVKAEMRGKTPKDGKQANNYFRLHTDRCDVISLLGVRTASVGGESRVASAVAIHDVMVERAPALAEALYQPIERIWEGGEGVIALPIWAYTPDGKFTTQLSPSYIENAQYVNGVRRLEPDEIEAIDLVEEIGLEIGHEFVQQPGQLTFLNNHQVYHGRTAWKFTESGESASADRDDESHGRLLLRAWLSPFNSRALPDTPQFREMWGSVEPGAPRGGLEPALKTGIKAKPPELVEAYATGKADYYGLYRRKFAGEDVNL